MIDEDGVIRINKVLSTPKAPEQGVFDVLSRAATALNTSVPEILSQTGVFAHGTTVSTNALITRRGAKVGVLFTAGFEDTLAIGRGPIGRVGGLPQSRAMDFLLHRTGCRWSCATWSAACRNGSTRRVRSSSRLTAFRHAQVSKN